jgi:hypothetical protein
MQGSALCADEVTDILLRQVPVDKWAEDTCMDTEGSLHQKSW